MSFVAIRAGIKSVLDTMVLDASPVIYQVLDGEQFNDAVVINAFPCVEIVRINDEPNYFTNLEDMHTYVFAINVYLRTDNIDRPSVEKQGEAVVDAILQEFTSVANITLGGVADGRIMPVSAQSAFTTWKGEQVRKEQIVIRARKIMDMT